MAGKTSKNKAKKVSKVPSVTNIPSRLEYAQYKPKKFNEIHFKVSEEEVEKSILVREKLLAEIQKKPNKYYPEDIEMLKNDDWWTLRFVKWNRCNEEKSLKQMITAFRWRKSFGILDRDLKDLPIEFAKAAAIFPYGRDYKGRQVIYLRVKVYRKISQLTLYFQQFVAGILNHVDMDASDEGYVFLFDVTGMGLVNVDFDFLQFLISLIQTYYPYGLRYAILFNVPRIVRPMWSIAKIFLGGAERTFRFCNQDEVQEFIPADQLPRYLGGESDFDFTNFEHTKECRSVKELAGKYGFTDADVEKYSKIFEPNLLEAQVLVQGKNIA